MINWIQTKAGLQMAETIIRQLPRITVCLEQLAKQDGTFKDIIKLADEMDIRKQENINLKYQIDKLQSMIDELIMGDNVWDGTCRRKCPRCNGEMRIDDYENGDRYSEDGKMPCPDCQE